MSESNLIKNSDLKTFNEIIKEPETEMTAEKHYNNFVAIVENIKYNYGGKSVINRDSK